MSVKQSIVVNDDLNLSRGKLASQVAHASLGAFQKSSGEQRDDWRESGQKKVVLASGHRSLEEILEQAKRNKIPAYLVKDAGRTEVEAGTATAVGLGPADSDKIDGVTGELKLIE